MNTNFFVEQVADISNVLGIVYSELVDNISHYKFVYGPSLIIDYGMDEVENLFPELKKYQRHGWFHYHDDDFSKDNHCQNWHIDNAGRQTIKRLFLAAWPTPTQYYNKKPNQGQYDIFYKKIGCTNGKDKVNKVIDERHIKNMETGILYCCSGNVIHRSSPGSTEQPRLLFRWGDIV